MKDKRDRPETDEVTEKMIDAGVYALREMPLICDWRAVVQAVYLAMVLENEDQEVIASATSTILRK